MGGLPFHKLTLYRFSFSIKIFFYCNTRINYTLIFKPTLKYNIGIFIKFISTHNWELSKTLNMQK